MIELKEELIKINKSVRLYSQGDINVASKLIIVLHGYGQLPRYFIQKFQSLSSEYFILAPEGFHRFYLNGSSGRVGASWMTKEAREDDIQDNNEYLQSIIEYANKLKEFEKTILLGFSQGGATAARFFFNESQKMDHLILWASVFPPDISMEDIQAMDSEKQKNHFVLGMQDEYFDKEAQEKTTNFFNENKFSVHLYEGTHDININTLTEVLSKIE